MTPCQTPGAVYHTEIRDLSVSVTVNFEKPLKLTAEQATLLERNLHNAVETAIASAIKPGHKTLSKK